MSVFYYQAYNTFLRNILFKLYGCQPISLQSDLAMVMRDDDVDAPSRYPGILSTYAVVESHHAFYIIQPFICHTVADLVTFSPSKLGESTYCCRLFILYQILKSIRHFHALAISIGDLRLKDIAVDDKLWVEVRQPSVDRLFRWVDDDVDNMSSFDEALITGGAKMCVQNPLTVNAPSYTDGECCISQRLQFSGYGQSDLSSMTQKWVHHDISTLYYLLFLNHLAGRNADDANHHPIVPWVVDFADGYRDLTRSKYRLNKGEEQLSLTYDVMNPESVMRDCGHTPFHVSDFLSDITYYVYKARRTEKSVLCELVRPRWVPNHYPASMQRLYEWTPDECIPEFYTDPKIFSSIHDDLPDLELPAWASDGQEFIRIHRELLEGEEVSNNLHHWIDLTFGYKVTKSYTLVHFENCSLQNNYILSCS